MPYRTNSDNSNNYNNNHSVRLFSFFSFYSLCFTVKRDSCHEAFNGNAYIITSWTWQFFFFFYSSLNKYMFHSRLKASNVSCECGSGCEATSK